MHDPASEEAATARQRTKARILPLCKELSKVKYHKTLTLDNEDYKAALCIFLAVNLMWDSKLEHGNLPAGVAFFTQLSMMRPPESVGDVRDRYLPVVMGDQRSGAANMATCMTRTLGVVTRKEFHRFGEMFGIAVPDLEGAVVGVWSAVRRAGAVAYEAFRATGAPSVVGAGDRDLPVQKSIVMSKPIWELANWLKSRGASLLALSDRPDEAASGGPEGSLLDARMAIYGQSIAQYFSEPE
jgi:hypothetical protein